MGGRFAALPPAVRWQLCPTGIEQSENGAAPPDSAHRPQATKEKVSEGRRSSAHQAENAIASLRPTLTSQACDLSVTILARDFPI